MSLIAKLLTLVSLAFALVITGACMGKGKMTKEQLEFACRDVKVDCENVYGTAIDKRQSQCDYKCNKNYTGSDTATGTGTTVGTGTASSTATATSTSTATSTAAQACTMVARICKYNVPARTKPGTCKQLCPEDEGWGDAD